MPYFSSSPQKTRRQCYMSSFQQTKNEANGYTSEGTHEPNSNDFPRFIYYIKRFTEMRTCTLTRCHSQMPSSPTPIHELNKDRKSTRLNSSHVAISCAVFC